MQRIPGSQIWALTLPGQAGWLGWPHCWLSCFLAVWPEANALHFELVVQQALG